MKDRKDKLTMPDAPEGFAAAIREGGARIRRSEAKRRRMLLGGSAAAALVLIAAGAFSALGGWRPRQDALSAPTASPTDASPTDASALETPVPAEEVLVIPEAHMTPDPSPIPTETPLPPGALLFGGAGYRLSEACAAGLPETPVLRNVLYQRRWNAQDPDAVAAWLWGDDYTKELYDFGAVYIHEKAKGAQGDFKVKAYVFYDDDRFHWAPDDPSKLNAGRFKSRDAALEWAEEWLRKAIPPEYFEHPSHPGPYAFEGQPVDTVYPFRWDAQVEGVAVLGAGLSGEICTFGPSFFLLDLGQYEPVREDSESAEDLIPPFLTAEQAVDALNWAAAQEYARGEESAVAQGDSAFGAFDDTIEAVRPVFASALFYQDACYRLSWEITLRSAERGSTRLFVVDAETGLLWNAHEGVVPTIYSDR